MHWQAPGKIHLMRSVIGVAPRLLLSKICVQPEKIRGLCAEPAPTLPTLAVRECAPPAKGWIKTQYNLQSESEGMAWFRVGLVPCGLHTRVNVICPVPYSDDQLALADK